MNRLQLWKVVSVVLLAGGLATAQHITSFSAPGGGTGFDQGTGGFDINPQGSVVGSFHDDNNVFHGFQCIAPCNTFSEYNAPGAGTGANQGTITFGNNLFGETVGFYVDANNVAHGFATEYPFKNFISLNVPGAGTGAGTSATDSV